LNEPAKPTNNLVILQCSNQIQIQIQIKEGRKGTYSRAEEGLSFCSYKETRTATTVTILGLIDSNKE